MNHIKVFTDASIKLRKLFKNDDNFSSSLHLLARYLGYKIENYEFDSDKEEQKVVKDLTSDWLISIDNLKKEKFSDENIIEVLTAYNEIFDFNNDDDDYEDDDEDYDDEDEDYDDEDEEDDD